MSLLKYIMVVFFLVNTTVVVAGKKYTKDQNGLYHFVIMHDHSLRANSRRVQNKQNKLVQKPTKLTCKQISIVFGIGTLIAGSCLRWCAGQIVK